MKKHYQEWKDIFWGGILFMGVAYLFSLLPSFFTLDLTSSKLHSLSKGSKEILRKLPEPVTLKLYYSKTAASKGSDQIRSFTTHFEYTKELLKLFESHSQNKVKLMIVDPRPDTNEEEEAVIAGLKKFQLTDTETYIFGLVAQSKSGTQKVIEFFDPNQAEKLEYELSKLLSTLHQGNKKRLGLLTAESFLVGQDWWIGHVLQELYAVTPIHGESIKDIDMLFVFGTKGLEEKMLKAIDQYLVNGGKVFFALDPRTMWSGEESQLSTLAQLFNAWGINVPEKKTAGDLQNAGVGRLNAFTPTQRFLPVFNCQGPCLKSSESASISSLKQITMVYPGVIEKKNLPSELKWTTLIQTSNKGNTYEDTGMGLMNPEASLERFKPGTTPLVIAARLDGQFPKAYPDTKVESEKKTGALVLVADQDFLHNQFAFIREIVGVSPANDNLNVLLNELDGLSGSPDLMDIRSKGGLHRPFMTIQKIQLEADQESSNKVAQINSSISRFQNELSGLATKANQNNLGVIQSEGLAKQKELQQNIARLKRELREAKRAGRERVEAIGSFLYFLNVAAVPLIISLIYLFTQKNLRKSRSKKGDQSYEYYDNVQTA